MRERVFLAAIATVIVLMSVPAFATNGDIMIGIGPVARSMGGVGIAAPQDAISAVFANPAAMCFSPYCPSSEADFSGTIFMPHVSARVTAGGETVSIDADEKIYPIPAIGISIPLSDKSPYWRFGFGAFGSAGLGVDYRNTLLDRRNFAGFGGNPFIAGEYTQLQILKLSPAIAAQVTDRLSVGLGLHLDYAVLDLHNGTSDGFGLGLQWGSIYRATDRLSLGINIITPQSVNHEDVIRNAAGQFDLELESPFQAGVGAAYTFLDGRLLIEGDVKWFNWANSTGYEDFDWKNQWVLAVGAQYKPVSKLALRVGYNFGENPVREHNNWSPGFRVVQGITFPNYYFETFRIVGFPAIVEHHVTLGIGYELTPRLAVNLGYMHAFENTITERGTDLVGNPALIQSSLSQDSVDIGLTWRF
jgi:long-chain fatty acid transport protein